MNFLHFLEIFCVSFKMSYFQLIWIAVPNYPKRTNDNLLITILGKPMRFLRNFLRKLKITTFFNTDITGPGFVITSSSSHDGPHFLSRLVIHRKVQFFKEEKTRVIQKWGNEENIQKRVSSLFIPDIHFTVFNFLTFPFCLALT